MKDNFGFVSTLLDTVMKDCNIQITINLCGDLGIHLLNYVEENVSAKDVKIIQRYTGMVNKIIWRKF